MSIEELKRNILRNAASNYVCLALRLVLGLLMFRMLYRELTKEEFGFWALLWSVFGYGVLLDFGFGFTAQKRVAELSVHQEWGKLSQVLSTKSKNTGSAISAGAAQNADAEQKRRFGRRRK